jgi:hypothetical protein
MRRHKHHQPRAIGYTLTADARRDHSRWYWPLPAIGNAYPHVVTRDDSDRKGIAIGYDLHTKAIVPVYAAHDGAIRVATRTASGFAATIDHGAWSTHYAQLDQLTFSHASARHGTRVHAGQIIGYTTLATPIRFELWRWTDEEGFVPTMPEPIMSDWLLLFERDPNPADAQAALNQPAITTVAA